MATRIPPPPITTEDKGAWSSWYLAIKEAINQLAVLAHNSLPGLQGGTTTQRYHLTATDVTELTGGGVTDLHQHSIHAVRTLNFPNITSNNTAELTATVTGAVSGAAVMVGPPTTIEAGLIWCAYVNATDTVTIRIHNSKGTDVNPASADWHIRVEVD